MINKLFLDLNNFKSNLGSVERGDSIELNIKLLNDEDYSRSKFRLLGAKSDGKSVEQIEGLNLEEKDLKVVLEDQFVNCEGIVKLELNVVSGETEITTKEFYFFVSNTMNASIIDSADSLPTLEKVSKYVDDAVDNLEALKGASEDITIINSEFKENEIKRKANEMLREKNEKARLQSEDIRITEEKEREANELERIQAENDRKVSESNRKLAENTRKTNEAARVEAELNRQSLFEENEEIRNSNENLRIAYEKERIKFNSEAKTDELNRKEAEKNRVLAEEERKSSEESRVAAEAIRQNTYTDFNESEEERKNNEIKRQEAEALRVEAETRRDNLFSEKEEERNTSFIESEKVRNAAFNKAQDSRNTTFEESETVREEAFKISEKARNDAEELRVTAESERVKSEKLRVDSEKARVLAEEERNTTFTQKEEERNNTFTQNETNRNDTFTQSEEERKTTFEEAENARKVAESKRVAAETGRVEAEKLRVTAETRRVEAESLRVTAEEERVAAEQIREEKFAGFENKISANTKELKGARTATTGEKFNSLDERIDCEVYRLNKKIEVSFLQQEDKESHVIENTVEGMTTDMVVKGRTLQNLWNGKIGNNIANKIKGETTYTIIITNCSKNTSQLNGKWIGSSSGEDFLIKPKGNQETYYIVRRVSPSNANNLSFYFLEGGEDTQLKILILEDDWINKPIPKYFEGIKSFGEAEGNKISILSSGKNLFNVTFEKGMAINGDSGSTYVQSNRDLSGFQKVPSNTQLILSGGIFAGKCLFNKNKKFIKSVATNNFTTTNDTYYIRFAVDNTKEYNVQLEKGTVATSYQESQQDKKDILLQNLGFDEGFRGINDISDELNSLRNVAIKRIGKREYREGDELLENIITDKTNTYYVLEEPIETPLDENINVKTFGERAYVSFENSISGTSSFKAPVNTVATISRLNRENRALEEENKNLRQDFESTTLKLTDSDLELVKQNVDMDFRLMEVEFALDIPQAILSSNIKFKNKKGEVKSMARTPYEMMKIVILSGDYDREDYMHKVGKYYERGRMTKEEHDELMSLMTADEVISK
ncbi:hypothetical protein [Clostridium perfringens]|uniref:hypothetical protein n=1 Tax=Clostridium perfringens TaxID=1502 RepID=UPI000E1A6E01|nr:hypothetical protein [Clostridium perfringens]MDH5063463.1 hypothetical protein [Clostridium perfringens]SUY44226.1 phage pre-neck appendage-like protein [Clostridium perfringens]